MPMYITYPKNIKNLILFKNMIDEIEKSLLQKYSAKDVQEYLEPLVVLVN
jgi:hypothetical protein